MFVNEIRNKKDAFDQWTALSRSRLLHAHHYTRVASQYALNRFEQRVYDANSPKAVPGAAPVIPLMTDADAADLRENMGFAGLVVEYAMGSGTRREANGAGQYRRVFDEDHEALALIDVAAQHLEALGGGIQERASQVADGVGELKERAVDSVTDLPAKAAEAARKHAMDALINRLPGGVPPLR